MIVSLNKIIRIIDRKNRIQIYFFMFLLFISTLLDGLSIGAIYPLIKFSISTEGLNIFNDYLLKIGFKSSLSQLQAITFFSLFILSGFFLRFLFLLYFIWWKSSFVHTLSTNLANKLYKKLVHEDYNFFKENNSSVVIRSFFYDVAALVKAINAFLRITLEGLTLIVIVLILALISFKVTFLTSIFFLISLLLLNSFVTKKIKNWASSKQIFTSSLIKTLQETFGIIKNILIEQNQKFFEKDYDKKIRSYNFFSRKLMFFQDLPRPILELITVVILCVSIIFFNLSNSIENLLPLLAIFGAAAIRIMPAISRIATLKQTYDSSIPSINSLFKFYSESLKENKYLKIKNNKNIISFKNSFELKNIYFKHFNSDRYIFEKFNLKVNKFDFVCISGKSGSGKTTLIDVISGLLKPEKGEIFFDKIKYDFENPSWKKIIAYIPQNTFLLDDTIKNNIIFGDKEFNTKKFNKVIADSQLEPLIEKLPSKENTVIGENGAFISVGERQRIGIARALYLSTEILICDEITSALDDKMKEKIIECLKTISNEKTIIFVSHDQEVVTAATKKIKIGN